MKKFHERLDYFLKNVLKLSNNAVAKELKINQGMVSQYVRGSAKPTVLFAISFCTHYKISANWLLLDVGSIRIEETIGREDNSSVKCLQEKKEISKEIESAVGVLKNICEKYL